MRTIHIIALIGVASACRRAPTPAANAGSDSTITAAAPRSRDLRPADLEAAEYSIQFIENTVGPIRFANREWSDTAGRTWVRLLRTASGDLDDDGHGDGVAILAANFGGTGTFVSAVPVLNRDGRAVPGRGAGLGDRTSVQAIALRGDTVVIDMIAAGPSDPACCPTDTITQRFRLDGDSLVVLP